MEFIIQWGNNCFNCCDLCHNVDFVICKIIVNSMKEGKYSPGLVPGMFNHQEHFWGKRTFTTMKAINILRIIIRLNVKI